MSSSSCQALLLVDGYNIIGAWSDLKKTRDRQGLESARRALVEDIINYTTYQGLKTKIVFDAHYQKTPSSFETHSPNLSTYYTAFGQTADTYIEKICASFYVNSLPSYPRIIVATSDRAQKLTVVGYGAEWMSAERLANEVEIAARRSKRKHRPQKQARGRFLYNSLDAKSQNLLSQWRHGNRSR
ncbi:MAG: NYN domain-containing protein [Prochloraceae cyanobacterium]|nr:NYN domain-containing protein [Prochloraceae cyanobacterium]